MKFLLLVLLSSAAFAEELTFDSESHATSGGKHQAPAWVLLNSKKKVVPQGRHCKCSENGELIGFSCSSKYSCELKK